VPSADTKIKTGQDKKIQENTLKKKDHSHWQKMPPSYSKIKPGLGLKTKGAYSTVFHLHWQQFPLGPPAAHATGTTKILSIRNASIILLWPFKVVHLQRQLTVTASAPAKILSVRNASIILLSVSRTTACRWY
jgi:hypothetical protein